MTDGAWEHRASSRNNSSNECSIAPVGPGLGLKPAVRGLRAAVWTTMSSEKPVILVVEDEALVRMLAVSVAEDNGFEALTASADEAIGILESRSDVRLMFTDVNMPGSMNGLRLAHAVRDRWPPVELLVTSALGSITAKDLPERGRFLAKPYDVATLSTAFQQMAGD
jgi:two-component system, response regulator PdtaR